MNSNSSSRTSELIINVTDDLRLALSALENSDRWRGSENLLIRFLTSNVNQNGFNGRVFNLNSNEWNTLYNYLKNVL